MDSVIGAEKSDMGRDLWDRLPGRAHYGHTYETKRRLASYWHQVDECLALGAKSVLVVGVGSGLVPLLLNQRGVDVTTMDIQIELRPRLVGNVCQLPFVERSFDAVVCCQVLEHMPFEFFAPSLCELKRVIRVGLVLSLPDRGRYSKIIPHLVRRRVVLDLPTFRLKPWVFNGEHYWEVNTCGYRLAHIQRTIDSTGLKTEKTFRVWELPYHRFWRLRLE